MSVPDSTDPDSHEPGSTDPLEIERRLATAHLDVRGRMPWSSNVTLLVELYDCDPSEQTVEGEATDPADRDHLRAAVAALREDVPCLVDAGGLDLFADVVARWGPRAAPSNRCGTSPTGCTDGRWRRTA